MSSDFYTDEGKLRMKKRMKELEDEEKALSKKKPRKDTTELGTEIVEEERPGESEEPVRVVRKRTRRIKRGKAPQIGKETPTEKEKDRLPVIKRTPHHKQEIQAAEVQRLELSSAVPEVPQVQHRNRRSRKSNKGSLMADGK